MSQPGDAPLRILHAPRNIAGQAGDIVAALRRLGHAAQLWEDMPDDFGRPSDRRLALDPWDAGETWAAVREAIERFDILHFHFAQTLVPRGGVLPVYWDLPIYRALGKRVYFTFHGSDIRLERVHREINPWAGAFELPNHPGDERIEKSIQAIRTYADRMFVASVNNLAYVPDAHYLPRVIDLAPWPELPVDQREIPVLVHAPTKRGTKGTDLILGALDALRDDGVQFELRLLERVPHDEVRAAIAAADILLDNVAGGSYGIVALEAMACSKVVVSNMSEPIRARHPDAPVVNAAPDTIGDVLRGLIEDRARRQALAARGRPFVASVHDADVIAGRLVEAYGASRQPVSDRTMPDWISRAPAAHMETLERRLDRTEAELQRSLLREAQLRRQLGLPEEQRGSPFRRAARRVLPASARQWLRSLGPGHR
jgi:glycosyltransferase involved in cell wall biosynthesis